MEVFCSNLLGVHTSQRRQHQGAVAPHSAHVGQQPPERSSTAAQLHYPNDVTKGTNGKSPEDSGGRGRGPEWHNKPGST